MKLYLDPRSSSSLRVLCYVAHAHFDVEVVPVSLMMGEHLTNEFRRINPAASVPALMLDDATVLTEALAIIEWLDSKTPGAGVRPADEVALAQVRGICGFVASNMHPITNMRVRKLIAQMSRREGDEDGAGALKAWCLDRSVDSLEALEGLLERNAGSLSFGNSVTLADFFVAPALLNAERFGCVISTWPTLDRVYDSCLALPAFRAVAELRPARS